MGTPTQYLCDYWIEWVRLPSICVIIGADGYAYLGVSKSKVSSHPVFPPPTGYERLVSEPRMSTLVFVDPESSTQADGSQSSRVPVPLLEDPYEAISTPPVGHVKESEGFDTSGAGSMSSDSTTPVSPDHPLTHDTLVLVPF
ncbi:hypothetical protein Tco_0918501 [Tanacetum coccineum]